MTQTLESGQYAAQLVSKLLERLAYQVNSTIHSRSADSVHDLRVAIRRFAQVLSVFKASFPARERRKIRRNLKEIMSFAGEVRDRDIAVELLGKMKSAEAAALGAKLSAQRKEAETVLLAVLRRWGARGSSSKWRAGLLPVHPGVVDAQRLMTRMVEKFFRAGGRAAQAHSSAADLHRFRVQAKKFRYSVELFRPVYGAIAEQWLAGIKRVQTLLGQMNDYRATREMVAELGGSGQITDSLKKKEQKKARAFRELWEEEYSGSSGRWIRSLERIPRKPAGRAGTAAKKLTMAVR